MFNRKIARKGLLAAGLSIAFGASAASAQDFNPFAFLFGGSQPAQEGRSAYTPSTPDYGRGDAPGYGRRYRLREEGTLDPSDPRLQRAIKHQRAFVRPKPAKRAETAAKTNPDAAPAQAHSAFSNAPGKAAVIVPTKDAPQGSLALFTKDKTLRAGDVVVTDKGFMVYRGGDAQPTKSSFVALNGARTLSAERNTLLALERVSRQSTPNVTVETVALREPMGPELPEGWVKPAAAERVARAR